MPRIAVLGGTGYLASLIQNQNKIKKNKFTFFSRKKKYKNYINLSSDDKNLNILENFDFLIHLAGPSQEQLKKNNNLIKKKNQITSKICSLCLAYNIKLIYVSSMHVYDGYGNTNLSVNSKINKKNFYSRSHYESEKIIIKKFKNKKRMYTILRLGNVFGFKKYQNLREINNNIIHKFCISGFKSKKILIKNGSVQRTYIPSGLFVRVINTIIQKRIFKNSIINIGYKNFNLKDISEIIKKRFKLILNLKVKVIVKKFSLPKKFIIYTYRNFKLKPNDKKIFNEIDIILKNLKKLY